MKFWSNSVDNNASSQAAWGSSYQGEKFFSFLNEFKHEVLGHFELKSEITIDASPFISTQTASVAGKPHVFLANFSGLKGD